MAIVLDRSGSMSTLRDDAIGGFNTLLADQKKAPGEALLTLVQFDHEYQIVHDGKPLGEVPPLNAQTYVPRGQTAYLDALGRTIESVGAKLSGMPDADRPARVIVVVITDGLENASVEYTAARVQALIEQQRNQYSWEFAFIGADEKAIDQAQLLGINKTSHYAKTSTGTQQAYAGASSSLRRYRSGKGYN